MGLQLEDSATIFRDTVPREDESKGVTLQLRVTPEARKHIEALRAHYGIPSTQVANRILNWFGSLRPEQQQVILNGSDEEKRRLARSVIEQAAGATPGTLQDATAELDLVEAAKALQALSARVLAEARLIEDRRKKKG